MADSDLSRTHPLTVLVRSLTRLGSGLIAFVTFTIFSSAGGGLSFLGIAALALLASAVLAAFTWIEWLHFRFGVVGDELVIQEGWLIKQRRTIPLARVQGVDIRANVLARILGLADVMVQTAGGGDSGAEARIGEIPLGDAEKLRAYLIGGSAALAARRAAAAGEAGGEDAAGESEAASGSAVDGATAAGAGLIGADPIGRMSDLRGAFGGAFVPEQAPVFELRIPLGRLVLAGLTSNGLLLAGAAVLGVAAQMLEFIDIGRVGDTASALLALAVPILIAIGLGTLLLVGAIAVAITLTRDYGFTVRRTGERLETEAGLLERRMTSMPVRRIQAVIVESGALRRPLGLASVTVNTAGFGKSDEGQAAGSSAALVPLARTHEIGELLHSLLWEAERFPRIQSVPRRALRFYVLVPLVISVIGTLVAVGGPLAVLDRLLPAFALSDAAPLIVAATVTVVAAAVVLMRVLVWRAAGFGTDPEAIAIRWGMLGRYRARLGRGRIQSLSVRQNPFQRRAGLATLTVASVSGSAQRTFSVRHIEIADAARIATWYAR